MSEQEEFLDAQHPDNHPLRRHHPHHELVHQITGFFLLFVLFVAFMIGLISDAPFGVVILGFSPMIFLALIVVALGHQDHLDMNYLVLALFVVLLLGGLGLSQLTPDADVVAVVGLNFVLGALFLLIVQQSYAHHHEDSGSEVASLSVAESAVDLRDVSKLFVDLEERCKQLNTAIGRAYSVYKGASAGMREKIKVQSSLYGQLDVEKKPAAMRDVLREIVARLLLLEQREEDVFSEPEQKKLPREGADRIVDVLADNEGEGILQAHASALSYARDALEQLR